MSNEQNHSLEKFKEFVRKHPSLVTEVRRGIYSWQEVYEDWYLLGEDNKLWETFRDHRESNEGGEEEVKRRKEESEAVSSLFDSLKNVDVQSMQKHVSNLSQALGAISGVISQFQSSSQEKEKTPVKKSFTAPKD